MCVFSPPAARYFVPKHKIKHDYCTESKEGRANAKHPQADARWEHNQKPTQFGRKRFVPPKPTGRAAHQAHIVHISPVLTVHA